MDIEKRGAACDFSEFSKIKRTLLENIIEDWNRRTADGAPPGDEGRIELDDLDAVAAAGGGFPRVRRDAETERGTPLCGKR